MWLQHLYINVCHKDTTLFTATTHKKFNLLNYILCLKL